MNATILNPSLRLAASLLLVGQLLYIVVTQFHTGGDANNHQAIFAAYAASELWTAVHAGQFAAMAILLAGLLVLSLAVDAQDVGAVWLGRFGAAAAVAALALYGGLQGVDGVANKQADIAWLNAPESEQAARFASAEAIRWIEWGLRSYHDYALGLAFLLVGLAITRATWASRQLGAVIALSGIIYLVQGWVAGVEGFSPTQSMAIVLAWIVSLVWMIWLAIIARRLPAS
jgi:hypothetical protein